MPSLGLLQRLHHLRVPGLHAGRAPRLEGGHQQHAASTPLRQPDMAPHKHHALNRVRLQLTRQLPLARAERLAPGMQPAIALGHDLGLQLGSRGRLAPHRRQLRLQRLRPPRLLHQARTRCDCVHLARRLRPLADVLVPLLQHRRLLRRARLLRRRQAPARPLLRRGVLDEPRRLLSLQDLVVVQLH